MRGQRRNAELYQRRRGQHRKCDVDDGGRQRQAEEQTAERSDEQKQIDVIAGKRDEQAAKF